MELFQNFQNSSFVGGPQKLTEDQLANTNFYDGGPMDMGKGELEAFDMGKYEGNPNFNDKSIIGNGFYDLNPGAPEMIDPSGAMIPETSADLKGLQGLEGLLKFNPGDQYTGDDPLVKGYLGSDFYESQTTANVVPYTYQGKEMSGSGSYASNFKKYLDSIGQGDLIQFPEQGVEMSQELAELKSDENNQFYGPDGSGSFITDTQDKTLPGFQFPNGQGPLQNNKLGIASLQNQYKNSYQNNNNNMGNFKNMEKLLKNIDGGIQSLIGNPSYMQNDNNLSQGLFSKSSSPNFIGGDILQWSSYK